MKKPKSKSRSLVLLPGLDGTASMHTDFYAAIAADFDRIVPVAYPHDRALSELQLIELARTQLPIGDNFVLLGESFSGPIAMRLAAEQPAGLQALILSTTFAKNPIPFSAAMANFVDLAPIHALPYAFVAWWLLGGWATPALDQQLQQAMAALSSEVLRSRARIALQADVTDRLATITVPTLCMRATDDRLLLPSTSRQIAAGIAHCQIVDIAAPHLLLQVAPIAAAAAIREFLVSLR